MLMSAKSRSWSVSGEETIENLLEMLSKVDVDSVIVGIAGAMESLVGGGWP